MMLCEGVAAEFFTIWGRHGAKRSSESGLTRFVVHRWAERITRTCDPGSNGAVTDRWRPPRGSVLKLKVTRTRPCTNERSSGGGATFFEQSVKCHVWQKKSVREEPPPPSWAFRFCRSRRRPPRVHSLFCPNQKTCTGGWCLQSPCRRRHPSRSDQNLRDNVVN